MSDPHAFARRTLARELLVEFVHARGRIAAAALAANRSVTPESDESLARRVGDLADAFFADQDGASAEREES